MKRYAVKRFIGVLLGGIGAVGSGVGHGEVVSCLYISPGGAQKLDTSEVAERLERDVAYLKGGGSIRPLEPQQEAWARLQAEGRWLEAHGCSVAQVMELAPVSPEGRVVMQVETRERLAGGSMVGTFGYTPDSGQAVAAAVSELLRQMGALGVIEDEYVRF